MKTEQQFKHLWNVLDTSKLGEFLFLISEKRIFPILDEFHISKHSSVIDVGCGTGRTLKLFRDYGYHNSIGIDIASSGLKICEKNGFKINKDVFLKDIKKDEFNKKFDLVFAEGLLEHFEDMQPIVDGLCRISSRYVLVLQPNHSTISLRRYVYRLFEIVFIAVFRREHIYEIPYNIKDYKVCFNRAGFKLIKVFDEVCKSGWGLLFEVMA